MRRALVLSGLVALSPAVGRAADPLPLLIAAPPPATAPSAATLAAAPLPSMALDPQVPESIYHGLSIGSEVFGIGGRGIRGGIGGDVFAGYDRVLGGGALLGLQGTTGYTPAIWGPPGLKGFDFGEASAQVGYPLGRFTPFVTAGLLVARPVTGPGLAIGTTDSVNDLMNGAGSLHAAPRVGAGFAYALTGTTTVTFDVTVGRGLAAGLP